MQEYMRALQDRFDSTPPFDDEEKTEANQIFRSLCSNMEQAERHQLIQLVDIQNARLQKTALNSFISGFRLAWGILRELADYPPYSFEDEQEEKGLKKFMASRNQEECLSHLPVANDFYKKMESWED